jgi:hypothetical protein
MAEPSLTCSHIVTTVPASNTSASAGHNQNRPKLSRCRICSTRIGNHNRTRSPLKNGQHLSGGRTCGAPSVWPHSSSAGDQLAKRWVGAGGGPNSQRQQSVRRASRRRRRRLPLQQPLAAAFNTTGSYRTASGFEARLFPLVKRLDSLGLTVAIKPAVFDRFFLEIELHAEFRDPRLQHRQGGLPSRVIVVKS